MKSWLKAEAACMASKGHWSSIPRKRALTRISIGVAALTAAGMASAQSTVTLFGILDASISYYQANSTFVGGAAPATKQSQWALATGAYNGGRLGFRATEDLGGGLSAGIWLEAGVNNDTGAGLSAGGLAFNRRSTISLTGRLGEVRLGRDYAPTFWNDFIFDAFGTVGVGASAISALGGSSSGTFLRGAVAGAAANLGLNSNYVRVNNTVGYFLPKDLGGFYGQAMYGLPERVKYDPGTATPEDTPFAGAQKSRTGRYLGGRFGYAQGPVDVAIAYGQSTIDDRYHAGVTTNLETTNLGASYDFGSIKLFGEYSNVRLDPSVESPTTLVLPPTSANFNGYMVGATIPVGVGVIRAAYSRIQGAIRNQVVGTVVRAEVPDPQADKFSLGYIHNLSRRTALYATFAYVKNRNGLGLGVGGAPAFSNSINTGVAGYLPDTAHGYDFGIRHSF